MQQKSEEELIEDEAIECAMAIWDSKQFDLPYTYCTECSTRDIKQRCVCNVVDMSALCARHWILRKIDQIKKERGYKQVITRVKLDLEDFCRI